MSGSPSPETREKIRRALLDRSHSPERRAAIRAGVNQPGVQARKVESIRAVVAGRPLTSAQRAAVSAYQRGRPKSAEHRAAISRAHFALHEERGHDHGPRCDGRGLDNGSRPSARARLRQPRVRVYCGEPATTLDHVLPWRRGGRATLDNIVPACLLCNQSKSDRTPDEWLDDGLIARTEMAA